MQQETLNVVRRRTLVLAGLGVANYVALRSGAGGNGRRQLETGR